MLILLLQLVVQLVLRTLRTNVLTSSVTAVLWHCVASTSLVQRVYSL
jgi:hypothetical protein